MTSELLDHLFVSTNNYWNSWIRKSTYQGSWKEAVHRSALALKLLIYEPTGAIVASPTFSLPEYIGGTRNWDYRASWIRDSSFTLYALIRLGFTQEANAYMDFIFERLKNKNPDGSLQIMYTIHGGKDLEEIELLHLDGHKGSKPVRIGNGAADHVQLDIYGELMDCIYLGQKFGKPLSYDTWVLVRELVDFVVANYKKPDLSIWEVRGKERHFTYSKVSFQLLDWTIIEMACGRLCFGLQLIEAFGWRTNVLSLVLAANSGLPHAMTFTKRSCTRRGIRTRRLSGRVMKRQTCLIRRCSLCPSCSS